jgi:hypothetical protein
VVTEKRNILEEKHLVNTQPDPRLWQHTNPIIEALIRRVEKVEKALSTLQTRDPYFTPEDL